MNANRHKYTGIGCLHVNMWYPLLLVLFSASRCRAGDWLRHQPVYKPTWNPGVCDLGAELPMDISALPGELKVINELVARETVGGEQCREETVTEDEVLSGCRKYLVATGPARDLAREDCCCNKVQHWWRPVSFCGRSGCWWPATPGGFNQYYRYTACISPHKPCIPWSRTHHPGPTKCTTLYEPRPFFVYKKPAFWKWHWKFFRVPVGCQCQCQQCNTTPP